MKTEMNIINKRNDSGTKAISDPLPRRGLTGIILIAGFLALVLFVGAKHANAEVGIIEPIPTSGNGNIPTATPTEQRVMATSPESFHKFSYKNASILEGFILLNAGFAAAEPKAYGWAMLIMTPVTGIKDDFQWNNIRTVTPLMMLLGLFIYDINIPSGTDQYKIFRQNFAAWNAIALTDFLLNSDDYFAHAPTNMFKTNYNARQRIEEPNFHVGIAPRHNGASLFVVYRY